MQNDQFLIVAEFSIASLIDSTIFHEVTSKWMGPRIIIRTYVYESFYPEYDFSLLIDIL